MLENKVNMRQKCISAKRNANNMVCCINRHTVRELRKMVILLFLTFLGGMCVLSPVLPSQYKRCDWQTGQSRVTHMVKGLHGERLREEAFSSLEKTKSKD